MQTVSALVREARGVPLADLISAATSRALVALVLQLRDNKKARTQPGQGNVQGSKKDGSKQRGARDGQVSQRGKKGVLQGGAGKGRTDECDEDGIQTLLLVEGKRGGRAGGNETDAGGSVLVLLSVLLHAGVLCLSPGPSMEEVERVEGSEGKGGAGKATSSSPKAPLGKRER